MSAAFGIDAEDVAIGHGLLLRIRRGLAGVAFTGTTASAAATTAAAALALALARRAGARLGHRNGFAFVFVLFVVRFGGGNTPHAGGDRPGGVRRDLRPAAATAAAATAAAAALFTFVLGFGLAVCGGGSGARRAGPSRGRTGCCRGGGRHRRAKRRRRRVDGTDAVARQSFTRQNSLP